MKPSLRREQNKRHHNLLGACDTWLLRSSSRAGPGDGCRRAKSRPRHQGAAGETSGGGVVLLLEPANAFLQLIKPLLALLLDGLESLVAAPIHGVNELSELLIELS